MPRPRINVMIMTQGEPDSPVRSYSLPWYAMRLAVGIAIGAAVLIILLSVLFLYYFSAAGEVGTLRAQLETTNAAVTKLEALQRELIYHQDFTRRIAGLLGIPVPDFADSAQEQALANAGSLPGGTDSGAAAGMEGEEASEGFGATGLLVTECPPDPNNRPRGLPLRGSISRGYAPRRDNPALRHSGIDLAAREGTPVLASADGTVEFAGEHSTYGFLLIIDHGNGFKTLYGHNSVMLVREGEKIHRGDRIAFSGNTGVSTAPHLHYEITENGESVDPTGFLGN